jgi:DNA polymerase-3 subunit delta'
VENFNYAEVLAKDRESMRETLLVWASYWRDVLLRASGAETPIANLDRDGAIATLASQFDLGSARGAVRNLETALRRLERNVNARLLAEVLLLDLPKV